MTIHDRAGALLQPRRSLASGYGNSRRSGLSLIPPALCPAAAAWGVLPSPFDDYRYRSRSRRSAVRSSAALSRAARLRPAVGAALAANPLAVRAVWFGTADAPSVLLLVLAFGFVRISRYTAAGAALATAILFKQFALVAVPFLAVALVMRASREQLIRAGVRITAVLAAGILPFLIADPGAMWSDTISYGTGTYRIIGYGLASLLLRADIVSSSTGYYPFTWLALLVWAPITVALLCAQWRDRTLAFAAAGFAISIYTLLFISRVFQTSYMIWPLTGIGVAVLLASGVRQGR